MSEWPVFRLLADHQYTECCGSPDDEIYAKVLTEEIGLAAERTPHVLEALKRTDQRVGKLYKDAYPEKPR